MTTKYHPQMSPEMQKHPAALSQTDLSSWRAWLHPISGYFFPSSHNSPCVFNSTAWRGKLWARNMLVYCEHLRFHNKNGLTNYLLDGFFSGRQVPRCLRRTWGWRLGLEPHQYVRWDSWLCQTLNSKVWSIRCGWCYKMQHSRIKLDIASTPNSDVFALLRSTHPTTLPKNATHHQ